MYTYVHIYTCKFQESGLCCVPTGYESPIIDESRRMYKREEVDQAQGEEEKEEKKVKRDETRRRAASSMHLYYISTNTF